LTQEKNMKSPYSRRLTDTFDELNYSKKKIYPTYSQHDRMEIVKAIRCVGGVFL
jgi:hypothetical protein